MTTLTEIVRQALEIAAEPRRAEQMSAYMKHKQAFLGVPAPLVKEIASGAARELKPNSLADCEPILRDLWQGQWREERYTAQRLAERWRIWRWPEALPLCEWMVRSGQWWDLVDGIATRLIGPLILKHPHLSPEVFAWIGSDDLWLRRTALLAQLKHKERTDNQVLAELILQVAHEEEFFIRKAIGWSLREHAKTDPDWVRAFVSAHDGQLSPLSRKEALKNL